MSKTYSQDHLKHNDLTKCGDCKEYMVEPKEAPKITYQTKTNGLVSITECSEDGSYICLEKNLYVTWEFGNVSLSGWRIQQFVGGLKTADVTVPNCELRPMNKVKIMASENAIELWGTGENIVTKLFNKKGKLEATHIKKTEYKP